MEVEFELGIVDPVRMVELEWHFHQFAPHRLCQTDECSEAVLHCLQRTEFGRRPFVDAEPAHVAERGGCLQVQKAGVESAQLFHVPPPSARDRTSFPASHIEVKASSGSGGSNSLRGMRLTPTERDRLLLFSAAELARARRARGLLLNVPEATALIADTVCEAARDGARLMEAAAIGASVLSAAEVLPGVADIVRDVRVEAVFDDGTRMVVVRDPFGADAGSGADAPGAVLAAAHEAVVPASLIRVSVTNTSDVPISITSHFHFFEVNPRLAFDRSAAYGMRLGIPAGAVVRFAPGEVREVPLLPIGGARVAIGFAGLVDGPLDAVGAKEAAIARAREQGYLFS